MARGRGAAVKSLIWSFAISSSLLAVGLRPTVAHAAQTRPITAWSYYMTSRDALTAYNRGCDEGHTDAYYHTNNLAILDFGHENANGSSTGENPAIIQFSSADIENLSEQYALGYWACTGSDVTTVLTVAIGTVNDAAFSGNGETYAMTYSGGSLWAHHATNVGAWVATHTGMSNQVIIVGANDIEPAFGQSSGPTDVQWWISGWQGTTTSEYVDYGSADGCSTTSYANQPCAHGWHQADLYNVSWGFPAAQAAPEIYVYPQQNQWQVISLYGVVYRTGKIFFLGPLDDHDLASTDYSAADAWTGLWNVLNGDSRTVESLVYSMEIHFES